MNTANLPPFDTAHDRTFDGLLQKTLRCSRYARHVLEADPALLNWLQENYPTPCDRAEMLAILRQCSLEPGDEPDLARAVRRLRKQVMVKLILRDLNGLCDLDEVMQAMTALAEVCVQRGQGCLMQY